MKTTKSFVIGKGKIVPAGTELDFVDGIANWDGNDINVAQVPAAACEYEMNKELNPAIWSGDVMNDAVRQKLLSIANDFYTESGFKAPIDDIILTGSMANYNYHDTSDLDVHVVIDYSKENSDTDLVRLAANSIKWKWNEQHNIRIAGHDVETYIQDANEPHTASGVFSLLNNKWLVVPAYKTISTSESDVNTKVQSIVDQTNDLQARVDSADSQEDIEQLLKDIDTVRYAALHLRKDAFADGEDEFSVGNLAFKELRNNGTIEQLLNMETQLYDKMHSIDAVESDEDAPVASELARAIRNMYRRGMTVEDIQAAMNLTPEDITKIAADDATESESDAMYQRFINKVERLMRQNKTTAEIADILHLPGIVVERIAGMINKYH